MGLTMIYLLTATVVSAASALVLYATNLSLEESDGSDWDELEYEEIYGEDGW